MEDELRDTVKEWRDARKAFFAIAPVSMDPAKRFPQDIWIRLGNAEHALMKLAEMLK